MAPDQDVSPISSRRLSAYFVRRGLRTGALAPRDDVTRFTWSSPALGPAGLSCR